MHKQLPVATHREAERHNVERSCAFISAVTHHPSQVTEAKAGNLATHFAEGSLKRTNFANVKELTDEGGSHRYLLSRAMQMSHEVSARPTHGANSSAAEKYTCAHRLV